MNLGQMWFAARTTAIEDFIKEMRENPNADQEEVAKKVDLDLFALTKWDWDYINREINKL